MAKQLFDMVAALETDSLHPDQPSGWSVAVRGRLQVASAPAEVATCTAGADPEPWDGGAGPLYRKLTRRTPTGQRQATPAAQSTRSTRSTRSTLANPVSRVGSAVRGARQIAGGTGGPTSRRDDGPGQPPRG